MSFVVDKSEDSCRAYRKFPADHFLWLKLGDEIIRDDGRIRRIKNILKRPIVRVDDRGHEHRYVFFGSTDSRIKNGVVGFFEEMEGSTARDVLNAFGDLKSVLDNSGPGKYIARLSLSFSSTKDVGELSMNNVAKLKDIMTEDGKVITDGCGVISEEYATEIAEKLGLDYVPTGQSACYRAINTLTLTQSAVLYRQSSSFDMVDTRAS
jgi:hypothetical protein